MLSELYGEGRGAARDVIVNAESALHNLDDREEASLVEDADAVREIPPAVASTERNEPAKFGTALFFESASSLVSISTTQTATATDCNGTEKNSKTIQEIDGDIEAAVSPRSSSAEQTTQDSVNTETAVALRISSDDVSAPDEIVFGLPKPKRQERHLQNKSQIT
jgi:hypothetical protein